MTRRQAAADRIWVGSRLVGARTGAALTGWVAASPGKKGRLGLRWGAVGRLTTLLAAGWTGVAVIDQFTGLLWVATGAWLYAAVRAGKPAVPPAAEEEPTSATAEEAPADEVDDTPEEEAAEPSPEERHAALLAWIRRVADDRPAVHLADLLADAHARDALVDHDVTALRTRLEARGITVHRQVSVGGRKRPGVRLAELPPSPSPVAAPDPSTQASTAA